MDDGRDDMGASGARRRSGASAGTLALIAIWTFLGTAFADLVLAGIPVFPARILASAAGVVVGLILVGAVAALPRAGAPGWGIALAGSAAGHIVFFAVALTFADVMQGNTAVMPPAEFAAFIFVSLAFAIGALAVGYWGATAILRRRNRGPGRWGRGPVLAVVGFTGLALVFAGSLSVWAAGSSLVLDETETVVHRVTITGTTIVVDAAVIKAGDVTWLATVSGRPPYDLTLVDVAGRSILGVGTPYEGATDFLLARMTMTPGEWYFSAGLEEADAGPGGITPGTDPGSEAGLPVGPLVARFVVTP
jgi:hypothetical protein